MKNRKIVNYGKSVRAKLLLNYKGKDYMYILTRFFNERLLYRLSVSKYRDNFLLKGGSLLYAMEGLDTRPTVDVDFMADKINRDKEHLKEVFKEILSMPCVEDGVTFDIENMTDEPITLEKKYPGTRFFVDAHMDSIVKKMTIDIGFGDVVTPCPVSIDFPLLLKKIPEISIKAYSIETVIAEKFHAMIDRDVANSRMKDFFDCYLLLTTQPYNEQVLHDAVFATFENRGLVFNPDLQLFTDSFYKDENRNSLWNKFLKDIKWKDNITFENVMSVITDRLKGFLDEYWSSKKNE